MRPALPVLLATVLGACVVWPEGGGPGAAPLTVADALARVGRGAAVLVDVRSQESYAAGHLPGALNVPLAEIEARALELRRLGRQPILYCG